jgi:hypothetical protein
MWYSQNGTIGEELRFCKGLSCDRRLVSGKAKTLRVGSTNHAKESDKLSCEISMKATVNE